VTQRLELRWRPTNRETVERLIGAWPDKGQNGAAARHARTHWDQVRRACIGRQTPPGGQRTVILLFIGTLADQVMRCERCWRGGPTDPTHPQVLVWWALGKRKALRDVVEVMVPEGDRQLAGVARALQAQRWRPLPYRPARVSPAQRQAVGA